MVSCFVLIHIIVTYLLFAFIYFTGGLDLKEFFKQHEPKGFGFLYHCKPKEYADYRAYKIECAGLWNTFYQLGKDRNTDLLKYKMVDNTQSAYGLHVGWFHSCALVGDGVGIRCWGLNVFGQIYPYSDINDIATLPRKVYAYNGYSDNEFESVEVGLTYTCVHMKNITLGSLCNGLTTKGWFSQLPKLRDAAAKIQYFD